MEMLTKIRHGKTLSCEESYQLLNHILENKLTEKEIKESLSILYQRGETSEELLGFCKKMRKEMLKIDLESPILLDCCGTGGSGKERFNISTASALILSEMGIPIAKHGNYGSKKDNGSFDFLEALNIPFLLTENETKAYFKKHNICFLLARTYHPYLKALGPLRKELPHRSIFNLLGPLCNPASPTHQIIGCINEKTANVLAETAYQLNMFKSVIVYSEEEIDELSLTSPNHLYFVTEKGIQKETFLSPFKGNLDYSKGNGKENANIFKTIRKEKNAEHPISKHIALNAGLGLLLTHKDTQMGASSLEENINLILNHIAK